MDQIPIMKTFLKSRNEELFEEAFKYGWKMPAQEEMLDLWREKVKTDPDEMLDEVLDDLIARSSFDQRMWEAWPFYQQEAENFLQSLKTVELCSEPLPKKTIVITLEGTLSTEEIASTFEVMAAKVRRGEDI